MSDPVTRGNDRTICASLLGDLVDPADVWSVIVALDQGAHTSIWSVSGSLRIDSLPVVESGHAFRRDIEELSPYPARRAIEAHTGIFPQIVEHTAYLRRDYERGSIVVLQHIAGAAAPQSAVEKDALAIRL